MLELAIMIEGQAGVNWPRWQRMARAVEDLGFAGLYRSDHFTISAPDEDSLDLWVSLTWLASHTTRIEFGPLVSPVSFRDPVLTARMGLQVDDLSGGRLHLGIGAGWNVREHAMFGYDLLDVPERLDRFEEGLEVITRLLNGDTPVSFSGSYYRLRDAILLPRPARRGGPPIVIGGNGEKRTLPLVARYAREWNGVFIGADEYARRNTVLDDLLRQQGRQPGDVRRSLMTQIVFGRDEAEYRRVLDGRSEADLDARGILHGTPGQVIDRLGRLAEARAQRVMLQWLALDDLDRLEAFAQTVLSQM